MLCLNVSLTFPGSVCYLHSFHCLCFLVFYSWIYSSLPASKQMLAVSATYPEFLANALTRYMRDPTFVRLNPSDPSLIGMYRFQLVLVCDIVGLPLSD